MNAAATDLKALEAQIADVQALARRYAGEIREHFGGRLRGIRLYGSAARGDWTPESDIDVLVLLDHVAGEDGDWIVNRAVSLGLLGSGLLLQPLFMPEADFEHLRRRERRFALEVEREGLEL